MPRCQTEMATNGTALTFRPKQVDKATNTSRSGMMAGEVAWSAMLSALDDYAEYYNTTAHTLPSTLKDMLDNIESELVAGGGVERRLRSQECLISWSVGNYFKFVKALGTNAVEFATGFSLGSALMSMMMTSVDMRVEHGRIVAREAGSGGSRVGR
jgi:hypothetical protein